VAAAWLGSSPTLVTALPSHPVSALIAADLADCGVRLDIAASYPGAPISASIMVTASTGERAIVSPTRAATGLELESSPALDTHNTLCVLVDGYFPSIGLPIARAARESGIPVVLDAGSARPYTDEFLANVDVVVASAAFAPPGTGGNPEAVFAYLRARGVMWSAITRGEDSILFMCPGGSGEVEVPAVEGVVDTLGAGDVFHGALVHRIATQGLSGDRFPEDLAFAAGVVARSITSFGTRAWLTPGR
jgi:sugar/nucleoside kinase (ribokinase family)